MKDSTPLPSYPPHPLTQRIHRRNVWYARLLALCLASAVLSTFRTTLSPILWFNVLTGTRQIDFSEDSLCPQLGAIYPTSHAELDNALEAAFEVESFRLDTYEKLGGAVRIP